MVSRGLALTELRQLAVHEAGEEPYGAIRVTAEPMRMGAHVRARA